QPDAVPRRPVLHQRRNRRSERAGARVAPPNGRYTSAGCCRHHAARSGRPSASVVWFRRPEPERSNARTKEKAVVSEDLVPEHRKLEGNLEYETALDTLFARHGRKLRIFERQLGAGYNATERHDLLRHFLLASRTRTIQIVLHDPSNLQRDCPRLINLLRQFSHAVTIHAT